MERTDLPLELQRLLKRVPYVAIATACSDGQPWNTPVVGFFDDHLNLYWSSDTLSQHSVNISSNPLVFVVVYDTNVSSGSQHALYIKMKAQKLESVRDVEKAKQIYLDRIGESGHDPFIGSCPRRIYRAVPEQVWSNIDGTRKGHFVDKRKSLSLLRSKS